MSGKVKLFLCKTRNLLSWTYFKKYIKYLNNEFYRVMSNIILIDGVKKFLFIHQKSKAICFTNTRAI